jgi:hypothetical protein
MGLLLVLLAGVSVYGYQELQQAQIQLNQVPGMLKSMSDLNGRLATVESALRSWDAKWQALDSGLSKLNRKVNADSRRAQSHAEELTAQLEQRLTTQWNEREQAMNARIEELGSHERDDRSHLARFEDELGQLRQEVSRREQENDRQLASLNQRVGDNQQGLTDLAGRLETERVDFELPKGRVEEPVPEIILKLAATDVRYQRFSGWIFFIPDARTLWIHDQDVQEPVSFYSRQDGRRYEVVMTRVKKDSAVGYLLLPGAKPAGTNPTARDQGTVSAPAGQ